MKPIKASGETMGYFFLLAGIGVAIAAFIHVKNQFKEFKVRESERKSATVYRPTFHRKPNTAPTEPEYSAIVRNLR